jgi:FkbM family methyltransferase
MAACDVENHIANETELQDSRRQPNKRLNRQFMKTAKFSGGKCSRGHDRYALADGTVVCHKNRYETAYVDGEIFEEGVYLKNGVVLPDDAVVVDVGANIGLFALSVQRRCPRGRVLAIEPSPELCGIIRCNTEKLPVPVLVLQGGAAGKSGQATFRYYPKYTLLSGFHGDDGADARAIEDGFRAQLREQHPELETIEDRFVQGVAADKLAKVEFECPLWTISDLVQQHHLPRIDLLKVDAERSELEILNGIDDQVWPLIRQVVMEVHDVVGGTVLPRVVEILQSRSFNVVFDEAQRLRETGIVNVYAVRNSARGT